MTDDTITLRKAVADDASRIYEIILQAKEQMRLAGSLQWQDGYPAPENISSDIHNGYGYVLCLDNRIIAYAAVIFDGDPAYQSIEDGQWLTGQGDVSYVLVHRLAVAGEMKRRGIATRFMRHVEELGRERKAVSFRIDTNYDNLYMQAILLRLNFTSCGAVRHRGNVRMAFEKLLT